MNAVVVVTVVEKVAVPRSAPRPPELEVQSQKPWKTSLLSSMMKSATRSIRAIGSVSFMYGLTKGFFSLFYTRSSVCT